VPTNDREFGRMKKKKGKLKISILIVTILLLFLVVLSCCLRCEVTFELENNDIYKTIIVNKGETINEPAHPEKEGHTFCGWYVEGKKYNFDNPIKESIKLEASWCINEYEVTIKTGVGSIINDKVKYNEKLNLPNNLTKSGYNFLGWFSNGDKVDSNTKVVSDMNVEGIWAKKDYAMYTVEHYFMDREGNYPKKANEKEVFTAKTDSVVTPSVKSKKGYTIPNAESIKVLCDGKTTIKYYYPINSYNLTVIGDKGISDTTGDGTYFYGDKVEVLYTLKSGYSFDGYSEKVEDNFYTIGEEDVVIYITTKVNTDTKYTVEHYQMNLSGKYSDEPTNVDVLEGTTDTKVTPKANEYEGFTSPDGEEVIINGDGSTVVKYYYERNKYDLHIVASTGIEKAYGNGRYYYGEVVTVKVDVKKGYTFDKWSNGNTEITFEHTIGAENKAMIAKAKVNAYNINYNLNNGVANNPANYTVEEEIQLSIPKRLGYTFIQWEGNNVTSDGKIAKGTTGDITVEAIWKANNYQIEYNLKGATLKNKPTSYTIEEEIQLSIPEKQGYTFVKWEGNNVTSDGKIAKGTTGDITVEAIFVPNNYTVIFDKNSATSGVMSSQSFTYDEAQSLITNSFIKTGYTFTGWNTNADGSGTTYTNQESVNNLATEGTITLYAQWAANTYNIEYNSNLGTGTMPIQLTKYDLLTTLYENKFERIGYTFNGWNTASDGTGMRYSDKEIVSNLVTGEKVTLYAQWKANTYTIAFDANTGIGTVDSQIFIYDESQNINANSFNKTGYTFVEWNTKIDGTGISYSDEENVVNLLTSGSLTLYAQWANNTYTVEFNANTGTGTMSDQTFTYDEEQSLITNAFEKIGYTFNGWNTKSDGTGISYTNSEIVSNLVPSGDITLYAQWRPNTYKIEFNSMGGTGTMVSQWFVYDRSDSLDANGFIKAGYTFNGWNTESDGSGTTYTNQENVINLAPKGTATLYAQWTANTYTVVFNANTGTGSMESQTHTYDETKTLSKNEFTKTGYTFSGWSTASDGSGTSYTDQEEVINLATNGSITLYAKWTANTYEIEYKANLGTGTMPIQLTKYDLVTSLYKNEFTKTGYTFAGWNTESDGTGTSYENQESVSNLVTSGTVTLYAQWVKNIYTVEFNANGGTGSMSSQTHTYDEDKTLSENEFTKLGYTFSGWNTKADGSGTSYEDQEEVNNLATSGSVALYAKWTANSYEIEYNSNLGTGTMPIQLTKYDLATNLYKNEFTKTGYAFAGWNTKADGSGTSYTDKESVSNLATSGTVTLYAKWVKNTYTVVFNSNTGTGTMNSQTHTYDEDKTLSENEFTKLGYTFAGWNTASDGSGTSYANKASVSNLATSGSVTLYAMWNINTYTIEYNLNGGTVTTENPINYTVENEITLNTPTKPGYTFVKWEGTGVNNGKIIRGTTGNITATAIWSVNNYNVIFNANSGIGTNVTQTFTYGVAQNLSENTFTKPGYTFVEWNTESDGTGTSYENQESVSNLATSGNVTLYAQWTPNTYTVVFNSNTGTGTMSSQTHTYDEDKTLSENEFTKLGYTFSGWNTKADGSGTSYEDQEEVNNLATSGSVTLYAKWTPNTYTVEFNANGGTGTMPTQMTAYDRETILYENTFERVGYTFSGWNTVSDGSGTSYADKESVSNLATSGTVTLYAKWIPTTYTIEYNLNGGTVSTVNPTKYTILDEITLNAPAKTGYTFTGWTGIGVSTDGTIAVGTTGNITATAMWEVNTYTIEYNLNGGTVTTANPTGYTILDEITLNTPSKPGYIFTGWTGTGVSTDGKITIGTTGNIMATANYELDQFKIIFDTNGGSDVADFVTYYGYPITKPNNPSKIGHDFVGWYIDSRFTTEFDFTQTMPYNDLTLYAKWDANDSIIGFISNGGTAVESIVQDYGTPVVAPEEPTKTGYDFVGWYSDIELNTPYVFTTMPLDGIVLYAKWEANLYDIAYHANGGTGIMPTQKTAYDRETILYENTFERVGYTFAGWNTAQNGTGTNYANQEEVSNLAASGTVTLYAKWIPTVYTIEYNLNGGTVTTANPTRYTILDEITLNAPSKPGYTFTGWTGTGVSSNGVIAEGTTGNITATAVYTANTYTVVFDANGGSGSMNSQTHTYDATKALSKNVFTKEGYTFAGWNTASDGSGTSYADKASVSNLVTNGSVTLYAIWTQNTYTVEFNANGGSGSMNSQTHTYDATKALSKNVFTKDGYTFAGWNTASDGSGTSYADKASVSNLATIGTVTLYAKWTANTYTVVFNANTNNVTGTMENQLFTFDVSQNLSENTFTKPGYTFAGWNTKTDGSGTNYANKESVSNLATIGTVTLYAKWTQNTYTVVFDANGGSGSMNSQTHTYDATKALSENKFERTGYTFTGWNTAQNGTGTNYANQEEVSNLAASGTVTLYAKWIPTVYTIEYNLNGGTVTTANPTRYTILDEITLNAPSKPGYTFTGWTGTGVSSNGVIAEGTTGNITATAVYTANTYTVVFDANGGSGSMNSQTHTYDATKALSKNVFTKEGYTFAGWNTASDGSGTSYADKASVSNLVTNGSVTLYAIWTQNTYTVEFNANGGSGSMNSQTHTYDATKALSKNVFTKDGYTFAGWNTASDGSGTSYADKASVSNLATIGTVTLYAKWTANTYTVVFNANTNNVTGTMENQLFTFDVSQNLSENTFTKPGYTFAGWNTKTDGSGTSYADKASVSNLATIGTVTLYAKWTPNTYTVVFDANGGEGTMSSQTHTYDAELALSENAFSKTGYTFAGWNTASDGSGTTYTNCQSIDNLTTTANGTVTLYAKWTPNTYTVIFNPNGGEGTMSPQTHTYDTELALSENAFSKTGYTFAGWNTASDGSGTTYTNCQSIDNLTTTANGTVTLYAKWTPNTYTVTFNPNGGEGTMSPQTHTYDAELALSENTFSKTGYTFAGWNTASDESGTNYSNQEEVSNIATSGTVTLYAKWTPNTYTVVFNPNGGEGTMSPQTHTYDTELALSENAFSKTGYTFAGWNTASDGSGTTYTNCQSIDNLTTTANGTVTLYAKWTPNTYTVTFNPNGGEGTMSPQTHTYDAELALSENTFSKTGYTFAGWNTASDGSGTSYTNCQSVDNLTTTANGTVTLYAKWDKNTYTVVFNANDGTDLTDTQQHTYDVTKNLKSNSFTRLGYTFIGWNTQADGKGTDYSDNASVSNLVTSGTFTLYAKWTPTVYKIEYNLNGGTVTTANPTSYTIENQITLNAPSKVGYKFTGWTGTGVSADGTISIGTTGPITATAVYIPNTYTVVFNANDGTDSTDTQQYTYGASQNLKSNLFTRVGYTFIGWNTETDGSGTNYDDKDLVRNLVPNGEFILYAQWRANSYTVVFNPNGGTNSMDEQSFTYDVSQKLNANQFNKTNYTFTGWNTEANGSGKSYADKASVINLGTEGNITLYAQWRANSYTVIFNPNGGEGLMNNQPHMYDVSQKLSKNDFIKTGYTFDKWNTMPDGSGISYSDEENVTNISASGTVTLYAQWKANTYIVVFNANDGTDLTDIQQHTYDKTQNLKSNTFTRLGYTFIGWNTQADGKGTDYADKASVSNLATSGTFTLYAKWTPTVYKIEYNLNGGTVTTANPTSYTIENQITLNAPSKVGYKFTGWTGTGVSADGTISIGTTGPITATAVYTPNTYTVVFNANDGTDSIDTQQYTYGVAQNLKSNPFTRVGYTFNGWNTQADGKGTNYVNQASVSNLVTSGTFTLYAKWTPISYTITYELDGGTATGNPTRYTIEDEITLNEPTKKDYGLIKWIINGNDSNGVIPVGTTGDLNIKAIYGIMPKIESLSFDVYKDGSDNPEPYYPNGENHSVYVGDGAFYMKLPRDAYIDIYSIGFTTNIGVYLNTDSQDIEGDRYFDISATIGGKGSITGELNFNIDLGVNLPIPNLPVEAKNAEGTKWRSTQQSKYLKEVKNFYQVITPNNLALAKGLAKSNEGVATPRYISSNQNVQNNTFVFFYPVEKAKNTKTITFVKDNIVLARITGVPVGSLMPDMGEYQLAGYGFKGWYLDPNFNTEYDPTDYVTDSITVYGDYEELPEYDTKWYYNHQGKTTYDICGKDQLKGMAAIAGIDPNFAGKTINLTCDVNLDNEEWIPIIGTTADGSGVKHFKVTFNGNGHTIKNLKITTYKGSELGLFGSIIDSTIKNLIIDGVEISSTTSSATAAVAGVATNSHAYRVLVKNAKITGQTQTAGIFGRFTGGSIKESAVISDDPANNPSTITSTGTDTGSAGASLSGTITIQDFYSDATVVTNADYGSDTGGIIGSYTNSTKALTMNNLLFTGKYFASNEGIVVTSGAIYGRMGEIGISAALEADGYIGFLLKKRYDNYGSLMNVTWLFDRTVLGKNNSKGNGQYTNWLQNKDNYENMTIDGKKVDWSKWTLYESSEKKYPKLKWIANLYSVTLNVNGGDALTSNIKKVILGEAYGTLPTPTRSGYTFSGWYTAVDGGTQVTSETIVTSEITTLYARWTQI